MNPRALQNNQDLLEYLIQLGRKLQAWQHPELAESVSQASRFASGSASEFMHEAQLALERLRKDPPRELSSSELQDLEAVLAQVEDAFQKIGGA
jgi:hypothetical protein